MTNTTQLYLPLEAPDYGPIREAIFDILYWNIEYDDWMQMYSFPTTNWGQAKSKDLHETYLMWVTDMVDEVYDYECNEWAIAEPRIARLFDEQKYYPSENSSMINAEDHDLNFSLFSLHIARVFKGFKASPESRGLSWEGLRDKTTLRLNPYYNLPFQNDPVSGEWTQYDHLNIDQCQRNKYEPDPVTDAWI